MSRTFPLFRWLLSTLLLAGILFLCAGRTDVVRLKTYVAVFAGLGLVVVLAGDPSQDGERRKSGPVTIEPGSRLVATAFFLTTVMIAALDAGRFHWIEAVSGKAQIVALAVLISAAALQAWATKAYPFFSTAIRIQADRGHEFVTHGPYHFIRHPGYLAMAIIMPATALVIGSMTAMIPASCYSALILHRGHLRGGLDFCKSPSATDFVPSHFLKALSPCCAMHSPSTIQKNGESPGIFPVDNVN